jgi:uncharacterized protein (TIGR03118 family)
MAKRAIALAASLGLLFTVVVSASARDPNGTNTYTVTYLQSNVPGLAKFTDPDLRNGWGISASGASPWWVSDNKTDKSTLYNGNTGEKRPLVVAVDGGPTGTVFNGSSDFKVDAGTGLLPSLFLFATEDGEIYGWNGVGTVSIEAADTEDSSYLGLAIGSANGANYLYAANFPNARVDVFNGTFELQDWDGAFVDPGIPDGYAPFGIQNIGGEILVAYAKQNDEGDEEVAGAGLGFVSAFGTDGSFHGRVASHGELNAPWGIAMAPSNFGKLSGDLLVGNFGDGRISAYHQSADGWEARGLVKGTDHRPIEIDGLWGIGFGNGANAGPKNTLFFAAGPNDEEDGLFGSITAP